MALILIADDDVGILETLQYLLLNEGHNVIAAKNGLDAMNQYKERAPDVVFMDVKMPLMNGFDAFFKIKEFDKNAKIILTSGYAIDDSDYQHAKKSGLVGLLSKPFSIEKISNMIDESQK